MLELTGGLAPSEKEARELRLEGADAGERLVRLLNEILFHALTRGFVTARVDARLRGEKLDVTLFGETGLRLQTEVKSATYHALLVEPRPGGVFARFVIDV